MLNTKSTSISQLISTIDSFEELLTRQETQLRDAQTKLRLARTLFFGGLIAIIGSICGTIGLPMLNLGWDFLLVGGTLAFAIGFFTKRSMDISVGMKAALISATQASLARMRNAIAYSPEHAE